MLLLSATPVNNQLADLRNQISFIAGGDVARDDRPMPPLKNPLGLNLFVKPAARPNHTSPTGPKNRQMNGKPETCSRPGRRFLQTSRWTQHCPIPQPDCQLLQGRDDPLGGFPRRTTPRSLYPAIDLQRHFLSFEQLNQEISALKLALYHPTAKLREDLPEAMRDMYLDTILGGFTQEGREQILIAMMKVNFLKRLESSVDPSA